MVLKAVQLKEKQLSLYEIEKEIMQTIPHVKSSLSFESLDNLVRGGRLSKAAGIIGGMLGIRLILEVKEGIMVVANKIRGSKKAVKEIIETIERLGVKPGEPVVLVHIQNQDVYESLKIYLNEKNIEYIDAEVGCTVGIHSGPKACGIFFVENY